MEAWIFWQVGLMQGPRVDLTWHLSIQSMVNGGMEIEKAASLAGLMESE